jgi:modification methylase
MVTSPPYPMIAMWDELFCKADSKIEELFQKLGANRSEKTVRQIYDSMHDHLAKVWQEIYCVLVDGGIASINIGDATRTVNGRFQLYPNHSRITEVCEKIGFTTIPYILWKKPTNKPAYKGKGAFLGSDSSHQTPTSHLIVSLFYCSGKESSASSRRKMPCVMRAFSRKCSGMNGSAKSGH